MGALCLKSWQLWPLGVHQNDGQKQPGLLVGCRHESTWGGEVWDWFTQPGRPGAGKGAGPSWALQFTPPVHTRIHLYLPPGRRCQVSSSEAEAKDSSSHATDPNSSYYVHTNIPHLGAAATYPAVRRRPWTAPPMQLTPSRHLEWSCQRCCRWVSGRAGGKAAAPGGVEWRQTSCEGGFVLGISCERGTRPGSCDHCTASCMAIG